MDEKLKSLIWVLLFAPVWLLLYAFLHEGGHALVILAHDGTIDSFWIFGLNAHVSAHGGVYSMLGEALKSAAGVLLPAAVVAIALFFYKPQIEAQGYHLCWFMVLATIVFSLLVWVIFPILSLFTLPPQGEDAIQFLNVTSAPPLLVSLVALLLAGGFVFFAWKKGLLRKVFGK